ncbi:MAG: DUF2442 domain-containing protein [Betaproteobacteria bacterium]|nr:DUF2442 domain-containing protein [Betaproteobacteria bacterium]
MNRKHFVLTDVRAETPFRLLLKYGDGAQFALDLTGLIRQFRGLKPLEDPATFATAAISEGGRSVIWDDDDNLELAADNLRARAVEAMGEISHEFVWNWMTKNNLTIDAAACAIGVSRRMLLYYRSGRYPVPRTVALACIGWEKGGIQSAKRRSVVDHVVSS